MPSIGRWTFTIPSYSSLFLYLQGCIIVIACLWPLIQAVWHGTRLGGDRSLFGLFDLYIKNPVVTSSYVFKAAYDGSLSAKRLVIAVQVFCWIIFYICSFFPDDKSKKKPVEERPASPLTLSGIMWFMAFSALILFIITELEVWREELKLQQSLVNSTWPDLPRQTNDGDGLSMRMWRRGVISSVAGSDERLVREDGNATESWGKYSAHIEQPRDSAPHTETNDRAAGPNTMDIAPQDHHEDIQGEYDEKEYAMRKKIQ